MEILTNHAFYEFAAILLISAIAGAVGRLLKQPLIVTFIAVGILVGPAGFDLLASKEKIELLAEIGIAVLLFVVGLKLDLNLIKTTGPVALITGLGQVFFTSGFGFLIALALGFSTTHAIYIAVALTFSSTIIIVKMLSDKKEVDKLHGQIAMGFLIVQDIVVIITMIILSAFGAGGEEANIWNELLMVFLKGIAFIAAIGLLMRYVIPGAVKKLAKNQELLVLSSIAWAVSLAAIGGYLGFSKEVGAFLGGISLASTQFREVISAHLGSIRDFLLLFFFIDLGSEADLSAIGEQIVPGLLFSAFVLVGNPIIVMIIMGVMGYRKRTGFLAGLTVAQISEFSLILAALGLENGHIDEETVGLITLVGLITISLSTYMILYSGPIFKKIAPLLTIFEKKHPTKGELEKDESVLDYIVVGIGRFGNNLAKNLIEKGYNIMIVDFDPAIVSRWQEKGVNAEYGDADDPELPNLLPIKNTKHIISTAPNLDTNIRLLRFLNQNDFEGKVTVIAHTDEEEDKLRKNGAHHVLRPYMDAAKVEVENLFSE
ncbi:cation:proton antiporter [Nafulsella turpanensis]|uniref:cation:proton antiporter n=1 Tax=Nafulsella turpanensis TaxID=1265690 RepID=UPI00034DD237|nr:cation:proton antiporter family protein [Nafulsella turpanensis]